MATTGARNRGTSRTENEIAATTIGARQSIAPPATTTNPKLFRK
jgi:hypothetical protein